MNDELDSPTTELLTLGPEVDYLYQEQMRKHVFETQKAMRDVMSHNEVSQYLFKVESASLEGRTHQDWHNCSDLLRRFFKESPIDSVRFHERYDALRGLKRAKQAITVLCHLEFPESVDNLDFDFGDPFEAKVFDVNVRRSYPHWDRDSTKALPTDWLSRSWNVADPPALVDGVEPKRLFFKAMGNFWGGINAFRTRDLGLIKAFQQSTQSRTPMAERIAERELLLLTSGYLARTVDVLEQRLDFWSDRARDRTGRIAFASRGIFVSDLNPAGRKLYADLSRDLCRSLSSDALLLRTSNVIADFAEQIQRTAASPSRSIPGGRFGPDVGRSIEGRPSSGMGLSL